MVGHAAIVNRDFAMATLNLNEGNTTYVADTNTDIGKGWYEYDTATQWDIVGGALSRNFGNLANAGRSVAQIFSDDLAANNYTFSFDYVWQSTDTEGDIWVQLYLYDNVPGTADLTYATRMDLTGATQFTTPTGNADWSISALATSGNLVAPQTTGSTISLPFTLSSSMGVGDLLGIRIGALNAGGSATGTLTFDNFSIAAVPESGTFALLAGFAALGLMVIRRRTRA